MVFSLTETSTSSYIQNDAFRQEYSPKVNTDALKKDIESYLGEYRFKLQEYQYELLYGTTYGGELRLLGIDDNEPMTDKAQRAITRRIKENKNTDREEAEFRGLLNLEQQLAMATINDILVWMSPPGLKSEGYGDYGFVFIGKIDKVYPYGEKHLAMSAIRVESPALKQFNAAYALFTGKNTAFSKAEKFLASPEIISDSPINYKKILSYIFNFQPDNKNSCLFQKIIPLLNPYILEFIEFVRQGQPKKILFQAFQTIELLALDLIKEYSLEKNPQLYFIDRDFPLTYAMIRYQNQTPPPIGGSCGNTDTTNIFNKYSTLSDLFSEDDKEPFICPKCGYETTKPVGSQCPNCHLTKEEAANQGYNTC